MKTIEKYDKNYFKQILKIVLIGILLFWLLNNIKIIKDIVTYILNIVSPFILGVCIAFILNIPMKFFEKKLFMKKDQKKNNKHRIISLILSILIILAIFILTIKLIIPQLVNVVSLLIKQMPYYFERVEIFINNTLQNEEIKEVISSIEVNTDALKNTISIWIKNVITSGVNALSKLVSSITIFAIGIVFAFYILLSKEKIKDFGKKMLKAYSKENTYNCVIKVLDVSNTTFNNFIIGQVTEATILGLLCSLGMLILNIPYAITIGVLVGITALIPVAGAFIGCIIGALLILAVSPIKAIIFIIFFLILQQIEGNIIYPKVVGNLVGLPGILVLFAITIGANLFGIIGMLIGLPIVSILYALLKEDINTRIKNKIIKNNPNE